MKYFSSFRRLLLLTGLALAFPGYSSAQVYVVKTDVPPGPAGKPLVMPTPFSLEIRNGDIIDNGKPAGTATIGNLLDYLKKQGKAFNIILGPGVADLRISDLELNMPEFNNKAVFEAIAACVEDEVKSTTPSDPNFGIYRLSLHEDSSRQTQVFNLTSYLNPDGKADDKTVQEKLESLTDIIFKTLHDLHPENTDAIQPPHYQFHQGANLLIVIGTPEALTIANQVVNALQPPDGNPQGDKPANGYYGFHDSTIEDAATALKWAQSLPNDNKTEADGSRLKADLATINNLFASMRNLQDGTPGKPLSAQEIQDFEKQLLETQKMLNDFQKLLPKENPPATSSP